MENVMAVALEPDELAAVRAVTSMLEQFKPARREPGACTAALIYDGPDGEPQEVVLDFTDGRREVYPVAEYATLSTARQYRLGSRAEPKEREA